MYDFFFSDLRKEEQLALCSEGLFRDQPTSGKVMLASHGVTLETLNTLLFSNCAGPPCWAK